VFARKIVRLFGHVTSEDIENEAKAVSALCFGGQCKYVVELLKHGWLTPANSDYFIDMEYCPESLEDRISQWTTISRRIGLVDAAAPPTTPRNNIETTVAPPFPEPLSNPLVQPAEPESMSLGIFWDPILQILDDITCGLVYIHGKRFVHRDLKPQNGNRPGRYKS